MRHRADHNQRRIVDALRKSGCSVVVLSQVGSGCPDILAARGGRNVLLEVKQPGEKHTKQQAQFHALWRGEIQTVDCELAALKAMG